MNTLEIVRVFRIHVCACYSYFCSKLASSLVYHCWVLFVSTLVCHCWVLFLIYCGNMQSDEDHFDECVMREFPRLMFPLLELRGQRVWLSPVWALRLATTYERADFQLDVTFAMWKTYTGIAKELDPIRRLVPGICG